MDLFSNEPTIDIPPGAQYIDTFLTRGEEALGVTHLDQNIWSTDLKRRVQHFGWRYDWTHEIPARKSDKIDGIKQARHRRISLTFRTVKLDP